MTEALPKGRGQVLAGGKPQIQPTIVSSGSEGSGRTAMKPASRSAGREMHRPPTLDPKDGYSALRGIVRSLGRGSCAYALFRAASRPRRRCWRRRAFSRFCASLTRGLPDRNLKGDSGTVNRLRFLNSTGASSSR